MDHGRAPNGIGHLMILSIYLLLSIHSFIIIIYLFIYWVQNMIQVLQCTNMINSLRPSDAHMRREPNHHWFR